MLSVAHTQLKTSSLFRFGSGWRGKHRDSRVVTAPRRLAGSRSALHQPVQSDGASVEEGGVRGWRAAVEGEQRMRLELKIY